jgi:hypothetical protein
MKKQDFDPQRWERAQDNAERIFRGLDPLPSKSDQATAGSYLSVKDFYAYMPMHNYIYAPTRETWPASSVNARIAPIKGVSASTWIDQHQPVEQLSWIPGKPMLIKNRLIAEGGWIDHKGSTVFNLYREPTIEPGDPEQVQLWRDHVEKIYPDDAEHIIRYLAHRVQRPGEKINHALVLGGKPGVGKDTMIEPLKYAVGPWNFIDVYPAHMLGRFNGFVKSAVLRISEARDLGEVNRYAFYEHMKIYTAAPPDVLRCDEKNMREYSVPNVCGVIITTNHKSDGIYLPPDDRRHYVAWCNLTEKDFPVGYWNAIYGWYEREGYHNVASYLAQLDLSDFDAKAPPRKTLAFWAIVDANRSPEDADVADALDALAERQANGKNPAPPVPVLTLQMLIPYTSGEFLNWLQDRKNRRNIPHRLESANYFPLKNPDADDGLWKIDRKRQAVYVHRNLSLAEGIKAARGLTNQ